MRVGVIGAAGRMGREVCGAVDGADDLTLAARVDADDRLEDLADADCEVVVEFSTPATVADNVAWCLERGIHTVVGATGWTEADVERWRSAAEEGGANAVVAPNFAIGAVLMMTVARTVARHLGDVEIIELHHEKKVDAPSGTAARTAELIREARGDDRDVPIHSVRLPGLVAHQEVIFGAPGQTLTIRHDSIDRSSFMPGVLLAVREVPSRRGVTIGLEHLLGLTG